MENKHNFATGTGYIRTVSPVFFKGEKKFVTILIDCDQPASPKSKPHCLHLKAWNDLADAILNGFTPGTHVSVGFSVYSAQNMKYENCWYHNLTLREITKD